VPAAVDNHKAEEFIGVDMGNVRVGIARGNSAARIAEPLETIDANQVIEELKKLAVQNSATGIVVGLPRDLNGNETAQTAAVRQWVKSAKTEIGLKFYWQDEALTSRQAEMTEPKDTGTDAVAAAIILQDFLDSAENDRVAA
jgi:putative Holliday junction resolvase